MRFFFKLSFLPNLLILPLVLILSWGNAVAICPELNPVTHNSTNQFKMLWGNETDPFATNDLENIKDNYQILFVKGFLSDAVAEINGIYFNQQYDWLNENGVIVSLLEKTGEGWDSENLPDTNAPFLIKKINAIHLLNPNKGIIIISHSKGGLDALAALSTNDGKNLLGNAVVGWISIQSPFEGTPIADLFGDNMLIRAALSSMLGGEANTLSDMRVRDLISNGETLRGRCSRNRQNANHIKEIGEKITVLSFASWKSKSGPLYGTDSFLAIPRTIMKNLSKNDNDGLVPVQSAILKNAMTGEALGPFIMTEGFDHAVPVMKNTMFPFPGLDILLTSDDPDRVKFTKILLKIWLDKK